MNYEASIASLVNGIGTPVRVVSGSDSTIIRSIVEDSRKVTSGSLFIARKGTASDGNNFINEAIQRGAVVVLTSECVEIPDHVTLLLTEHVPLCAALLAENFYSNPSHKLKLIGITGTNGKTTTSWLCHSLLNSHGVRTGLIGTVGLHDGRAMHPALLTTPPAIELSQSLARMVENGCSACVIETSSHALHQQRTAGLEFDVGIFTNLSGDHLDYHKSHEEYLNAKSLLFEALPSDGYAIVNMDDPASTYMLRNSKARAITCSLKNSDADCCAHIHSESISTTDVAFTGAWGSSRVLLPLIGQHNVMNALQAFAACHTMGMDRYALVDAIDTCIAPSGRLERIDGPHSEFSVFVDYAHTDDALLNVLKTLRPLVPEGGSLCVVFGCGGDRDTTKRPRMAQVAAQFADEIVVTSDNPRTENPESIIAEILAGIPRDQSDSTVAITDRREAIRHAIEHAEPGDVILIAGKGHEDYQIIGTERRPFDDRRVASEALESLNRKATIA